MDKAKDNEVLTRPDCDNLAKSVLDALQAVLGADTKVSRLTVTKAWACEGSTSVTIATAEVGDRAESERIGYGDVIVGAAAKESIK